MRKRISIAWIGLLALFMVEGALAQGVLKDIPLGKWWTNKRIIQELRLTPEQQSKIDAVWTQNSRNLIDQQAEFKKLQLDLSELLAKDSIDEAAAMKVYEALQQARLSLERGTFLMRLQIKNLLSPEQQQKVEMISERQRQQKAKNDAAAAGSAPPPVKKSGR